MDDYLTKLTFAKRTFTSWTLDDGEGPILSLKLDEPRSELHLVRYVDGYVHRGYDSGGGVYLTREVRERLPELVATFDALDEKLLQDEVPLAIARAITGTRLPLTPVEAPLPAFTFGRLWYRLDEATPSRDLEFDLRSRSINEVIGRWGSSPGDQLVALLKQVFLEVSLSPHTHFVDRVLEFLRELEHQNRLTNESIVDFETWLLRLVNRHLTAYDLVTFHYRGANYPDALLLDAVLNDCLARLERESDLFTGEGARSRRSALRQSYCLRRRYEHHPVPDEPTSPGERLRVYPDGRTRVPEEQILQPHKRRKQLFADDPLLTRLSHPAKAILAQSVDDLSFDVEAREMGTGLFLDRPFGGGKGAVAVDATPLLASLAYSPSIATQRLRLLEADLNLPARALNCGAPGIALSAIGGPVKPGTISLTDAVHCSTDFVFFRTLSSSVDILREVLDFGDFEPLLRGKILLARSATSPGLIVYDKHWVNRLELEPILEQGYVSRRGIEMPTAGMRVMRCDNETVTPDVMIPLKLVRESRQ